MRYYDKIAPGYDELHREEQERKLLDIIDFLQKESLPTGSILDVGCGTGFCLDLLAKKVGRPCIGIEPSKGMIAQYKGKQEIMLGSAEALPFPDNRFAVVVSITAVQNFADVAAGIEEMRRVLKRGGLAIISCLKKSSKLHKVTDTIASSFTVLNIQEQQHDLIFLCKKEVFK